MSAEAGLLRRSLTGQGRNVLSFLRHVGQVAILGAKMTRVLFTTRFDLRAFLYQFEQLGVKSLGIAAATSIFVGIVMTIQFAFSLEDFGAQDSTPRVIGISEARELAPSLTALVVGARIGAGIAAELGSMAVTEQIDAIRALGADPIRKLVVPRVLAGTLMMPLLTSFALLLGLTSAMLVSRVTFGIPIPFFISASIDSIGFDDLISGVAKTPFFGFFMCLLGCHFGMTTRGGTEGVGRSTTTSVVTVAITILVSDAILTQLFLSLMST